MTDLEITRLCAEAMGYHQRKITDGGKRVWIIPHHPDPQCAPSAIIYDPLHDDAQAMALVKKFGLQILPPEPASAGRWVVSYGELGKCGDNTNLNRAICECVVKMQQAKKP